MAGGALRSTGGAGGILSHFTRHRTLANLVMVLMIVAGVLAYPNMRAQFFPDVVVDTISVSVAWPGAGAEDVDAGIVQLVEPALLAVEGVTSTEATSQEGRAQIRLEFEPGADMDRAERDVTTAVAAIATLPEDAEDPVVRRGGWSDRVTDIVLTGPIAVDQLARLGDEMVGRLFAAGATRTTVQGVAAPEVVVEVPALALVQHDIGLSDIAGAIAREVTADPAGDLAGQARLRTGTERRSVDEIAGIVLRRDADGSTLTVGDVAVLRRDGVDRDRAIFVGPDPAVTIRVSRSAQGDAIGLQATVEEVVAEMQPRLPQGVTATLTNSQAELISGRLALLIDNALMGLALVVGLLFLFLNARTAFWVAVGIPVALSAGIAVMYLGGLTINMMSLFALILMLGIIVDDAIVVGEHADFRVRSLGESPVVAAETAARRMFLPVFAATLTTVIAFFGLVAIGGRFGDLISAIPFTVIAILVASLAECFLVLPHHLSHGGAARGWIDAPSRLVNRGFAWFAQTLFRPFVRVVVHARYAVLAGGVLLLATQAALVIRGDVPWRFFSQPEQGSVSGGFAMLPAATREDSLAMMRELQRATDELAAELAARDGVNPVTFVTAEIGSAPGRGIAGSENKESWQLGGITIQLVDADFRPYSSSEFVTMLQDRVQAHPLAETVSFRSWGTGPAGDAIDIQLYGASVQVLKDAAEALKARLARYPEVSGLEDTLAYDKEELILTLTPRGEALGLTIDDLGRTLRDRLNGIEAATWPEGLRSASVRVALPDAEQTADAIDRMQVRTGDGLWLPLGDLVTVERRTGFASIGRENGVILISVTGAMADDDAARATAILTEIERDILPAIESEFGVGTALSGLAEQEQAFLSDARTGLILCLAGIYLSLAWIFGSWVRPAVVMAVIPFGLVGAIWGHSVWGIPMSLFTVVGLIGMIGIVINDSIVLVSTIDDYAQTRGPRAAIVDAVVDRLRPVFLTTATTVLGLAPLMYEGSSQAEFLKPTVVTLVFGLSFGMVLVLLIVPALVAVQGDVARLMRAARRARGARAGGIRPVAWSGIAAGAGLFALLLWPVVTTGAAWPVVAARVPALDGAGAAYLAFALSLAVALMLIGSVATLRRWRRRGPVSPTAT